MTHLDFMVTNKKRIQAYVDLPTYEFLKAQAEDRNISLSKLAGEILQAHSVVDDSSEETSSGISSVAEEEFISVLEEFRREVFNEMSKMGLHSEVTSDILLSLKSEMVKMTAMLEKDKEDFSRNQKKKKGFGK